MSIVALGQNTMGLLSYDISQTYMGHTLIYPHNQPDVFLINNCGEIVHRWVDDDEFRPGNTAYLQADGTLIKTKRSSDISGDAIWAGGAGTIVEIRSWENELLWTFEMNDSINRLHHDIEPLPNGNILMIAWELIAEDEAIQAGRDPANMTQNEVWSEIIIEVDPDTDEIVWE